MKLLMKNSHLVSETFSHLTLKKKNSKTLYPFNFDQPYILPTIAEKTLFSEVVNVIGMTLVAFYSML